MPADDGPARAEGGFETSWSSQSRISLDRVSRAAIAPMIGCWTSARISRFWSAVYSELRIVSPSPGFLQRSSRMCCNLAVEPKVGVDGSEI